MRPVARHASCAALLVACACHKGPAAVGPAFEVSVSMVGASPSDAESMASVVERQVAVVPKVARLRGTAHEGMALVRVDMERGTDPDADFQALMDALKPTANLLPREAMPPVVVRAPGATVARYLFQSETLPLSEVSVAVNAAWATPVAQTAGVGGVESCGEAMPRVLIDVDAQALAGSGLTIAEVAAFLRAAKGGTGEALRSQVLATKSGAPLRLADVARVSDDETPPRCRAFDAKGAVLESTVRAQPTVDAAKVREALATKVGGTRMALPPSLTMASVAPGRTVEIDLDPAKAVHAASGALREAVAEVPGVGAFVLEVGPASAGDAPPGARVRLASTDAAVAERVTATVAALPFVRGAGEPNATVELVSADRAAIDAQADAMRAAVGKHARIVRRLGGGGVLVTRVVVDRDAVSKLGVLSTDVALALDAQEGVTVSSYFGPGSLLVPVVLRMKATLDHVYVKGSAGPVPLAAVASMQSRTEEPVLLHEGQFPMVGLRVQTDDVKALAKAFSPPVGMQYRVTEE